MDAREARQLIREELASYEGKPYVALVSLIGEELHYDKQGQSGAKYQIEILITWDSTPNGAIRVLGPIDDGGWRAFLPLTESILINPNEAL